jgi:hypothetical protein
MMLQTSTMLLEVSMLVKNHVLVLWVMTQHNLLGGYQCFRATQCLHLQNILMLQHIPPLVLLTLGNDAKFHELQSDDSKGKVGRGRQTLFP